MKPVLFDANATDFASNGIGRIGVMTCTVTEARNGSYELKATCPVGGQWVSSISYRSIICAPPAPGKDRQPFRVYRIVKSIGGTITVYAQHLSYDLSDIPVQPFDASDLDEMLTGLKTYAVGDCPYTFWTDISATMDFVLNSPESVRSILGSTLDALDTGELEWDVYAVKYHSARGSDRGITIRYGKNMTDFQQDANCASVYTGIYPFYLDDDGNYVEVDGCVVNASGTYSYSKILPVDLTDQFDSVPTKAELLAAAQTYLSDNDIGVPSVSITVDFADAKWFSDGGFSASDKVYLCDTLTVEFPQMGVSAKAKVIETVYNVMTDKYDSITLGDAVPSYVAEQASAMQQQAEALAAARKKAVADLTAAKSELRKAQDHATQLITGNLGGYVVLHDSTGDNGAPDELLIMDDQDYTKATRMWRFNMSGLGYSAEGYNGTFGLAMTMDGAIVADYITAGIMSANRVRTGILQSVDGLCKISLDNGALDFNDKTLYINSSGEMGAYGTCSTKDGLLGITKGTSKTGLFQGQSGYVDYVKDVYNILGVAVKDYGRIWFNKGLCVGTTDPNWIFGDGGVPPIWDGGASSAAETVSWSSNGIDATFDICDVSGNVYALYGTVGDTGNTLLAPAADTTEPTSPAEGDEFLRVVSLDCPASSSGVFEIYTGGAWQTVSLNYCKITATGIGKSFAVGDEVLLDGAPCVQWSSFAGTHTILARDTNYIVFAASLAGTLAYGYTVYSAKYKTLSWTYIVSNYSLSETSSEDYEYKQALNFTIKKI